jgi:hypothetical protein
MKNWSPHLLLLLSGILACCPLTAEPPGEKPFVQYDEKPARYLKRLHRKGTPQSTTARFSFRKDYPGGFAAWQTDARGTLEELLGLHQISKDVGNQQAVVRLGKTTQEDGYRRQRGEIETEPGVSIPFWLLVPDGTTGKPRPLALCAHGHDRDGWNTYAGVYRNEEHRSVTLSKDGNVGVQAVQRGFVTVVPATRGLAEAVSIPDPKGRHGNRPCRAQLIHCLLAGRTAIGERVWDTQRILDWALAELPGINPKKVLMLGNSGGGVLTVYVAALDQRISVAVPSCSFTSYTSSSGFIFHCDCCLVPRAQLELGDMADIGALAAPRFLLAVHGRKDSLHSFPDVEAAMARVRLIYSTARATDHFAFRWGAEGHKFYPDLMWPFIESALEK